MSRFATKVDVHWVELAGSEVRLWVTRSDGVYRKLADRLALQTQDFYTSQL